MPKHGAINCMTSTNLGPNSHKNAALTQRAATLIPFSNKGSRPEAISGGFLTATVKLKERRNSVLHDVVRILIDLAFAEIKVEESKCSKTINQMELKSGC